MFQSMKWPPPRWTVVVMLKDGVASFQAYYKTMFAVQLLWRYGLGLVVVIFIHNEVLSVMVASTDHVSVH